MADLNISEFTKRIQRLEQVYKNMPAKAANEAVNFSKERFVQQNWVDNTTQPWRKRKREKRGDAGRAILVKKGRLKRSIRRIRTGPNYAVIGTDVPYAPAHNFGIKIRQQVTVRQHKRKRNRKVEEVKSFTRQMNVTLPRRQFMGNSTVQTKRIERQMTADILRAIK
jgi:phage gpG-like protein